MKRILISSFAVMLLCLSANIYAQNSRQDFTLVNKTGVEIHRVYISEHSSDEWGEDILGKDVMALDEEWDIKFDPKENVCNWDLRIEDQEGNAIEWQEIDLCKYGKITLKYDGQNATADCE